MTPSFFLSSRRCSVRYGCCLLIIMYLTALNSMPNAYAQTEAVYTIDHFTFESGEKFNDLKVGYVSWGALSPQKDNAILLLPGTSGTRHSADAFIGSGKAYDTDRYFVVSVDPIGGGNSSSPKDGLGTAFPKYSIRDMVHAQHRMITEGLGLSRLVAVGGSSMGSFQSIEWGINYPEFMAGLILIVPAARSDLHFGTIVDAISGMVTLDPAYLEGHYSSNPTEGLRRAAVVYYPWRVSDEYLATLSEAGYEQAKRAAGDAWVQNWDANSLLWRYRASREHNVAKPFGGDMEKALGRISAQALIIASATDRTIPGYLTRELYHGLRRGTYVEIPSILGHSAAGLPAGTPEYNCIESNVKKFLGTL